MEKSFFNPDEQPVGPPISPASGSDIHGESFHRIHQKFVDLTSPVYDTVSPRLPRFDAVLHSTENEVLEIMREYDAFDTLINASLLQNIYRAR